MPPKVPLPEPGQRSAPRRRRARATPEAPITVKGSPLPNSLVGQLLIAMPTLQDPRFAQSVIYVCAHTDEGAMGLVINRPLASPSFGDLLKQLSIEPIPPARSIRLCAGGPVDNSRGFVLHSSDWTADASLQVDETFALTASLDILKAIAEGGGPRDGLLALGYAGWGAGQLDGEMQQNAWMTAPADRDVLFDGDHQTKWRRAFAKLRIDPALLSSAAGHA
ncbi:MAG TPA: YqgE/AlgH family protein [Acetobacteraceae bacterium]|jgi:putative transcriptional regulator|nr:YqgE/AlgH family protein [Acetobacteraceae bacterium]